MSAEERKAIEPEWETTGERTVKWNKEQSDYLLRRLASVRPVAEVLWQFNPPVVILPGICPT